MGHIEEEDVKQLKSQPIGGFAVNTVATTDRTAGSRSLPYFALRRRAAGGSFRLANYGTIVSCSISSSGVTSKFVTSRRPSAPPGPSFSLS